MDVGDVLAGRYELLEEVGVGGMGRVLRAQDRTLGRVVAVKLLASHLLGDTDAIDALRDEARLAAAVRHPNVVQVLDAVLDGTNQPAIVMEYVDGPSLRQVVPDHGLDLDEALRIAAAVAEGLAAVHEAGLVHRDVSPGNVLLDRGVPRLTDFGIARTATATITETVRGSVGYLAPEQASGDRIGPPADVYALACLTTKLLTGAPPFDADQPLGVVHQHLNQPPSDLRERRPAVPGSVAAAVTAALTKDPADRTQTPGDFLAGLGGDLGDTGTAVVGGAGTEVVGAARTEVMAGGVSGSASRDDGGGGRRLAVFLAGAVIVGAALLAALAFGGDDEITPAVEPTSAPSQSPSAAPPPSSSPSSSPSPSPSPTPSLAPTEEAFAAVRNVRGLLVDLRTGEALEGDSFEKLDERLSKVNEKLRDEKANDAAKELREFRKEVAQQREDGLISPQAEESLLEAALDIEAALDQVPRGQGQDDDDDD